MDPSGIGGGMCGVDELPPVVVPQFERFNSAGDKPVIGMRGKRNGFDLPVLLVQVGGGGNDGEVDEIDHEDAALGLLAPQSVDEEAVVVVGDGEIDDAGYLLEVELGEEQFGAD